MAEIIRPGERIDPGELELQPWKPVQLKESTKARLDLAKAVTFKEFYRIIEEALELYYHNTTYYDFRTNEEKPLIKSINHRQKEEPNETGAF